MVLALCLRFFFVLRKTLFHVSYDSGKDYNLHRAAGRLPETLL